MKTNRLVRAGTRDTILDNLIAEKKATPMIVVMDNLIAAKPGESATLFAAWGPCRRHQTHRLPRRPRAAHRPEPGGRGAGSGGRGPRWAAGPLGRATYTEMTFADLVPMIERTYRVRPGKEHRAMAGLSRAARRRSRRP